MTDPDKLPEPEKTIWHLQHTSDHCTFVKGAIEYWRLKIQKETILVMYAQLQELKELMSISEKSLIYHSKVIKRLEAENLALKEKLHEKT